MNKKWLVLIGCLIALVIGLGIGYVVYLEFPVVGEVDDTIIENNDTDTVEVQVLEGSIYDDCLYHIKVFSIAIDDEYTVYDIKIDQEYNVFLAKLVNTTSSVSQDDYELVMSLGNNEIDMVEDLLDTSYIHDIGDSFDIIKYFSFYITNYSTNKVLYSTDDIDTELNTLILALVQGDTSYFDDVVIGQEYLDLYDEISLDEWYGFYYYLSSENKYISYETVDNYHRLVTAYNYLENVESDKIEYYDDYECNPEYGIRIDEYNYIWLTSSVLKQDFEDAYHKLFGSDKTVEYEEFEPNGCDICNLEDDSVTCYWNGSCGGDVSSNIFMFVGHESDSNSVYLYIDYLSYYESLKSYNYGFIFRLYKDEVKHLKITFNSDGDNYYWVSSELID